MGWGSRYLVSFRDISATTAVLKLNQDKSIVCNYVAYSYKPMVATYSTPTALCGHSVLFPGDLIQNYKGGLSVPLMTLLL